MEGAGGSDRLTAGIAGAEAALAGSRGPLAIDLAARTSRPAVLHDADGWIDFGPAGGSYYYSRTRMAASGVLTIDGSARPVRGTAWFDHQWGDFIAIGGGWDWFAVELADGTDLMVSRVRDPAGLERLMYGTLVGPDGSVRHVPGDRLTVTETSTWTSPSSGAVYPAAWTIALRDAELVVDLVPTVADQELDTRPTTGVIYWEGSTIARASRDGTPIDGRAYVELTGYAGGSPP
jgi:predicted secreted hydrolase